MEAMSERAAFAQCTETLQQSFIGWPQKTANVGSCAMHAQKRNFSIILSCPSMSSRTGAGTSFPGIISGSQRNCPHVLNSAPKQSSWGVVLSAGTNSRLRDQGLQVPLKYVYGTILHTHRLFLCMSSGQRRTPERGGETLLADKLDEEKNTEMNL